MVRHGSRAAKGYLTVFSVADPEEARMLLTLACPTNRNGEWIAKELTEVQNMYNLARFSDRLAEMHEILVGNGQCRCSNKRAP